MDRASIYTRDKMSEKSSEWKEKKLEIFWCPTYSLKHNLIKIIAMSAGIFTYYINSYNVVQKLLHDLHFS